MLLEAYLRFARQPSLEQLEDCCPANMLIETRHLAGRMSKSDLMSRAKSMRGENKVEATKSAIVDGSCEVVKLLWAEQVGR